MFSMSVGSQEKSVGSKSFDAMPASAAFPGRLNEFFSLNKNNKNKICA